jgi:CIC family chloride channel protein
MLSIYSTLGILAGLAGVVLTVAVGLSSEWLLAATTGIHPTHYGHSTGGSIGLSLPEGRRWFVLLVPTLGGLSVGLIALFIAPEVSRGGIDPVLEAYHRKRGAMRKRVPFLVPIAAALTIGSGGSAGTEGPVGQMGAGFGAWLSDRLRLRPSERRVLVMAGLAAGIGAVFHAPMAAAIFAAEVLYAELDIERDVLVPGIIASTIAYGVYGAILGWEPIFALPPVQFGSAVELIPYTGLAILLGLGAIAFTKLNAAVHAALAVYRIPSWLRPALGGLGVGIVGLFLPAVLGTGYGIVQSAADATAGPLLLLALGGAKIVVTALTAGSGGAGGKFAPTLVMGGAFGGAVGLFTAQIAPGLDVHPAAFAVVGMAGFFAAASNTLFSTVIMVAEVAGTYRLLVPALWVCTIAWFVARNHRMYESQALSRFDAPGPLSEMMSEVLRRIRVRDALSTDPAAPLTVFEDTPLRTLVQCFADSTQSVFPIVDRTGERLLGVVDGRELRRHIGVLGMDSLLIASDFRAPALAVTPEDTLHDAIQRMTSTGYEELLVVADDESTRLIGLLSRRQVITAYHRRMLIEGGEREVGPDVDTRPEGTQVHEVTLALRRGGVLRRVAGRTEAEALAELVKRAPLSAEVDRARLLELLVEREALSSTGVGEGMALPHPSPGALSGIGEPIVVLASLQHPVPWNAVDGNPVDTVALVLANDGGQHLAILGGLAKALRDPGLRASLRGGFEPEVVLGCVSRALDT